MAASGKVLKSMKPGEPGTKQWSRKFGKRLVCVRYRGHPQRRVRSTTVEIVVNESFWDPTGYQNHKSAMSNNGHSR